LQQSRNSHFVTHWTSYPQAAIRRYRGVVVFRYRRGSNLLGAAGEARMYEDDGGGTPAIKVDPHGLRDSNLDNELRLGTD
jgi:hypothetical protein